MYTYFVANEDRCVLKKVVVDRIAIREGVKYYFAVPAIAFDLLLILLLAPSGALIAIPTYY